MYSVIGAGIAVLIQVSLPPPERFELGRTFFWIVVTLIASAFPVRLPDGVRAGITTGPLLAVVFDPGVTNPFTACWVAFLGTFELRDLRGEPKWYGTLFNKSVFVLAAFGAWVVLATTDQAVRKGDPFSVVAQIVLVGATFALVNNAITLIGKKANVPEHRHS